jgi:type IV pilus assembly protein PilX
MLTTYAIDSGSRRRHVRQEGVAVLVALIMLVALTLAGITLVRSISTTNIIAGNMAFQQAATNSADAGIENAITWLEANNTATGLHANSPTNGYIASRQDPSTGQSWESFWSALAAAGRTKAPTTDASENSVAYVIHRLCNGAGDPTSGINCNIAPTAVGTAGNSKGAGVIALLYNSQVYYRITVRVTGPRNTLSFVQAVVAL